MIDQQSIDDQHWVERYLADQLSDAERAEFEAYVLEHPEVVTQLEHAARLKGGLAGLQQAGELQSLIAPAPAQSARAKPRWHIPLAIAATVLVAVAALILRAADPPPAGPLLAATRDAFIDAAGQALSVVDSYEILRIRGDTYDSVIQLPTPPGVLEVRVAPEFEAPRYRVSLIANATTQPVAELSGLPLGSEGALFLYLRSSALLPGQYRLEIRPDAGGTDTASTFRLNVLPAKP